MTASEGRRRTLTPSAVPDTGDSAPLRLLRGMLPTRSPEDIAAGEIPVAFGVGKKRKAMKLPVLSIRKNRAWKEQFYTAVMGVFTSLEQQADGSAVLGLLSGMTDLQLTLLVAYDENLDKDWLEDNATEDQLLTAVLGVTAAAFPLAAAAIEMVRESKDLQNVLRVAYLRSTISSPTSTEDGPPAPSKMN